MGKMTIKYENEDKNAKMPDGMGLYAYLGSIKVPLGGGSSKDSSFTENGYKVFDDGFIIQWGIIPSYYNNTHRINFTIPFAHSCLNVQVSNRGPRRTGDATQWFISVVNKDNYGFNFYGFDNADSDGASYIAIGY